MPLPPMHPYADARVDDLLSLLGGADLQTLQREFLPAPTRDPFQPDDDVAKYAAALARQEFGRRLFMWIFEISFLAPYPVTVETIEATALAAAKHQARAAVGKSILALIAEGERLLTQPKDATDENLD